MLRQKAATGRAPNESRSHVGRGVRAILVASLLAVVAVSGQQRQEGAAQPPAQRPGQTVTLLPDGRWLLLGGEGTEQRASFWDPATALLVEFETAQPRAWHTATVVPDGTVFVFGGVDAEGDVIATPERFDPVTRTFQSLPAAGLDP